MQHSILLGVETHLLKGLRDDAAHHRRPRRDRRNVQEVLRYVRQKRTNASSEQKRGGETLRPNSNATQAENITIPVPPRQPDNLISPQEQARAKQSGGLRRQGFW